MNAIHFILTALLLMPLVALAGASSALPLNRGGRSALTNYVVAAQRVLWQSDTGVTHAEKLLAAKPGQVAPVAAQPLCELQAAAGVLLDFGVELQGSVKIITPALPRQASPSRVRVRLGESAMEAMAELGYKHADKKHSVRDQVIELSATGTNTVGASGFRFARIDNVNPEAPVLVRDMHAVLRMRNLQALGAFRSSDERLNRIWEVGAYTVQLCLQGSLIDGIKRDRIPWMGDMAPEVCTINSVFGFDAVVTNSIDGIRSVTPVTKWMCGIPSYSMWWVFIQEEMWMQHGDRSYLEAQRTYLVELLRKFAALVGPDGWEKIEGRRFLDWPTSPNKPAVTAGLHALLIMTLESGSRLMMALDDKETATICTAAAVRARRVVPDANGSKSAAALLSLAGLGEAKQIANEVLKVGGPQGLSTFYGYFVLQALTKSGDIATALDFTRTYWGTMLDYGATTFWEDFNLPWTNNAARIDELTPTGKKDLHGDYGAYCYVGYRHSLCHGWSSGPTAWLSRTVLGIQPVEPGFKRVRIAPQLGDLKWVEGAYPTPFGLIRVRHERRPDGSIQSQIAVPPEVQVEK